MTTGKDKLLAFLTPTRGKFFLFILLFLIVFIYLPVVSCKHGFFADPGPSYVYSDTRSLGYVLGVGRVTGDLLPPNCSFNFPLIFLVNIVIPYVLASAIVFGLKRLNVIK